MKDTLLPLLAVVSLMDLCADRAVALEADDAAVARWKGSWVSAGVVSADGAKVTLKVQTGPYPADSSKEPPTEIVTVPVADVAPAPTDVVAAKPGDLVLASFYPVWLPRRFKAVKGESMTVVNLGGQEEADWAAGAILMPPPAWRPALQAAWDAGKDLTALADTQELRPVGLGSPVKPGDEIVYGWVVPGETKLNFSEGKVKSVTPGKVRVIKMGVDGPQPEIEEVEAARVAPKPSLLSAPAVKLGDVVMIGFYYFAHHIPWMAGRVDGMCGSMLAVTLSTGESRSAQPGGFTLIQR